MMMPTATTNAATTAEREVMAAVLGSCSGGMEGPYSAGEDHAAADRGDLR